MKRYRYVLRYETSYDYLERETVSGTDYSVMGSDLSTTTFYWGVNIMITQ
jgi:hypothetical protein